MEIERKYLLHQLPEHLEQYPFHRIEQGYLCTSPVVRIRRQDQDYYLTYKGGGLMVREEYQSASDRDSLSSSSGKDGWHSSLQDPLSAAFGKRTDRGAGRLRRPPTRVCGWWRWNFRTGRLPKAFSPRNGSDPM